MVFGLFKKKPDKTKVAVEVIPKVLQVQLMLAGASAQAVSRDHWALGYIFGFHDGMLQAMQVSDKTEGMAVMAASFEQLFDSAGGKLLGSCLDLQRDQVFRQGVLAGGQEAFGYLQDKTPPMGLGMHLQGMAK